MTAVSQEGTRGGSIAATASAYVALTKPRIIELLLITTVPSMLLAAHGLPAAVGRAWPRWSAAAPRRAARTC